MFGVGICSFKKQAFYIFTSNVVGKKRKHIHILLFLADDFQTDNSLKNIFT